LELSCDISYAAINGIFKEAGGCFEKIKSSKISNNGKKKIKSKKLEEYDEISSLKDIKYLIF